MFPLEDALIRGYCYLPIIEVVDAERQSTRTLLCTEIWIPSYQVTGREDHMHYVATRGKTVQSFIHGFAGKDFVYLLYSGDHFDPKENKIWVGLGSTIVKIDKLGKLHKKIHLPMRVSRIAVSDGGDIIYGINNDEQESAIFEFGPL